MPSDEEHLRYCILFVFQLKKNAAVTIEMICSAFGEGAVTHKTHKKWFHRDFAMVILTFQPFLLS